MVNYITIDGGTTNTRVSLVKNYEVSDTLKFNIGARVGIDNNDALKNTIKEGIETILAKNNLSENEIVRILASGMITSEYGILNLEHLKTPAGIKELKEASYEAELPEISKIKFVFMRGVKTSSKILMNSDMMRGEETELMGIMNTDDKECVYVLPGSHSKIIKTDTNGKIEHFVTMLTGEMIASLSQNTILKGSITLSDTLNEEYLIKGFEYCKERSINEALFKVRILKNLYSVTDEQLYSFFVGVVLCGEIVALLKMNPRKIVIGGRKQLKEAMKILLANYTDCEIVCISDKDVDKSSAIGMVRIFENKI